MGDVIRIVAPFKPVPKQSVRFSKKTGVFYKEKSIKSHENVVAFFAIQAMKNKKIIDGPVKMKAFFYFKKPKYCKRLYPTIRPDDDNLLKIRDAFNGIVWVDDAQVVESHLYKIYTDKEPYSVFEISTL